MTTTTTIVIAVVMLFFIPNVRFSFDQFGITACVQRSWVRISSFRPAVLILHFCSFP
jgi:hypothetical protein